MRVRTLLTFALGFYAGAWAGRERYHQINRAIARMSETTAGRKAKAVGDLTVERARTALHLPEDLPLRPSGSGDGNGEADVEGAGSGSGSGSGGAPSTGAAQPSTAAGRGGNGGPTGQI